MKKNIIVEETAIQDFERWLDYKKVKNKKRADNKEQEEVIVDAIMDGSLIVEKDCYIEFKLDFPLENEKNEPTFESFKFKPRIKVFELNSKLKGVKSSDVDGRIVAYIAAVTGQNAGIIKKLDTQDYNICQAVIMYFL